MIRKKMSNSQTRTTKLTRPVAPTQGTPWEKITPLTDRCMRMLGIADGVSGIYGKRAQRAAFARYQEGATESDLALVVRHAASLIVAGDRWMQLRNLSYLWGTGYSTLLAAAKNQNVEIDGVSTKPALTKSKAAAKTYRAGEKWQDALASRFAESQRSE